MGHIKNMLGKCDFQDRDTWGFHESSVADPHQFDADADPACYLDADPDPNPTFLVDADPDPNSSFQVL